MSAQKIGPELTDSLKNLLRLSLEDTSKVSLLGKISFQYFKHNTDSGLYYGFKALDLAKKIKWGKGVAFSSNYIGINYGVKGNYPRALDFFYKSLSQYSDIKDKQGIAFMSNNIGNLFRLIKQYDKSIEYYEKALAINIELNNKIDLVKNYNNLGIVYGVLLDYSKSDSYYYKSLRTAKEINNEELEANALINIAENKTKMKDFCKALEFSLKAVKLSKDLNLTYDCAVYNRYVGEIYLKISESTPGNLHKCIYYSADKSDNLISAKKHLLISLELMKLINDLSVLSETSLLLSVVYERLNDTKNALLHYKQYSAFKDSLFSTDNSIKIANIEKQHEVESRDKQIKIKELEIDRKNYQLAVQIVITILIFALASILFYSYYKMREKRKTRFIEDERKKNEIALRESEERFRLIFENNSAAFAIVDAELKIYFVNQAFCQMSGYLKDECIGGNWFNIINIIDPKNVKEFINKKTVNADKTQESYEFAFLSKNGDLRYSLISLSMIYDNKRIILSLLDITPQKNIELELVQAKEAAEQLDKLKSEFLAQMSHEIRSPMNVVISLASILLDDLKLQLTKKQIEYFEGINSAGRRLVRTVDLILNASEIRVGSYVPTISEFNLIAEVLERIKSEYVEVIERKGLKFNYSCKETQVIIKGDKYSVYQIFSNLVDNAVKYTKTGFVSLIIEREGSTIKAVISDTGIGMSQAYMARIYQMFTQEDRGYSRRFEGNGLGLYLVKKYCELNGIFIHVESKKNRGTRFILEFKASES